MPVHRGPDELVREEVRKRRRSTLRAGSVTGSNASLVEVAPVCDGE